MDILHLRPEDIRNIEISEYSILLDYCWNTYSNRRVDYWIAKAFGGEDKGQKGKTIDWRGLNPAHQALKENKRKKRLIPKKFLESLRKNV